EIDCLEPRVSHGGHVDRRGSPTRRRGRAAGGNPDPITCPLPVAADFDVPPAVGGLARLPGRRREPTRPRPSTTQVVGIAKDVADGLLLRLTRVRTRGTAAATSSPSHAAGAATGLAAVMRAGDAGH